MFVQRVLTENLTSHSVDGVVLLSAAMDEEGGLPMKKYLFIAVAIVAALNVAGCAGKAPPIGKGKAPAPIVTKG
jgi:hypothetical protein